MSEIKQETYISVDIEADGPLPGQNSMISLGAAVIGEDETPIYTFYTNIHPLEGACEDPSTMKFWAQNLEAWQDTLIDPVYPYEAIKNFNNWVRSLSGKPVLVAYPTRFDIMFIDWYMKTFLKNEGVWSYPALDIRSYAMAVLKTTFRKAKKSEFPKNWTKNTQKGTKHNALDDAIEQGILFQRILKDSQ